MLRIPTNSLRHADFFNLEPLGNLKLRSVSAACASALFRTAHKTITFWPTWMQHLTSAQQEFLPICQHESGKMAPAFWDSTAIAYNLSEAYNGFQHHPKWKAGASAQVLEFANKNGGRLPPPARTCPIRTGPIQKQVYSKLMAGNLSVNIFDTIKTRLRDMFEPYTLNFNASGEAPINVRACLESASCLHFQDLD